MANIIIMNLSSLRNNSKEEPYESDLGVILGTNTADAPMKYLIKYIKEEKKQKIDKILTVVTSQAETAFDALKTMLAEYDSSVVEPLKISGKNELQVVNDILKQVKKGDTIYIESTGGLRNTTYTLMTIVRILEYSGVTLEKAIYSNHSTDKSVSNNKIEDITDTYRTFNLLNAVNSFTSYGSSYELENYFTDSNNGIVTETIKSMKNFSEDITLCRTSGLDKTLENLNTSLTQLMETSLESKDSVLFKSLAGVIKSKFYMDRDNKKIEYPDVVRWCVDNKLIQQAVTIYVEKMPKYFYEKKFYSVSNDVFDIMKSKNEKSTFGFEYELFYSGLMTGTILSQDVSIFKKIIFETNSAASKNIFSSNRVKTDEEIIAEALYECENVQTFKSRTDKKMKKLKYDALSKNLDRYFKVKRAIYDDRGNKRSNKSEIINKLKEFPEIQETVKNQISSLPKLAKDFLLKYLDNNEKFVGYIFDVKNEYSDNHLNFISNIGKIGDKSYKINVSESDARNILGDIYYAKTLIRNKLNHASEDESKEECIRFFSKNQRYVVDSELSVDNISSFLKTALDTIENLSL